MRLAFFLLDYGVRLFELDLFAETVYSFLVEDFAGVFLEADCYLIGVFDGMKDQQLL